MKMSQVQHGHGIELQPGMTIAGKWNDQHYTIKRKLGSGTVGAVYLCVHHGKEVALKISEQNSSITVEVNVLKALNRVQRSEEHTSELQSRGHLVCRLLLEKKKKTKNNHSQE